MKTISCQVVCDGIAIGKVYRFENLEISNLKQYGISKEIETEVFINAKAEAINELKSLSNDLNTHKDNLEIINIQISLLEDFDFNDLVLEKIKEGFSAEWSVDLVINYFKNIFSNSNNQVIKDRVHDLDDINNLLIKKIRGIDSELQILENNAIIVSNKLYPSDLMKLDLCKLKGIITKYTSKTSHLAIMVGNLNIPLVSVFEDIDKFDNESEIIINSYLNSVYINPDQKTIRETLKINDEKIKQSQELLNYVNKEAITKDNKRIIVAANVSSLDEAKIAFKNGAEGIGLFRTEFIYLDSHHFPTEEEQYLIYKEVLSIANDKKVVIRTLDIGADKNLKYFKLDPEENPALGIRGIRVSLKYPEIFKTQIRALLRASNYGRLAIMFPMISYLEELETALELVNEVKTEFKLKNINYSKNTQVGIMIETPAAALISNKLAKLIDFFSIGTNDLTQYTLGVDRLNENVGNLFDSSHESILKLIEMTAKAAKANNINISICGESASNQNLIKFYIDNNIDMLSVKPNRILEIKKKIIES